MSVGFLLALRADIFIPDPIKEMTVLAVCRSTPEAEGVVQIGA